MCGSLAWLWLCYFFNDSSSFWSDMESWADAMLRWRPTCSLWPECPFALFLLRFLLCPLLSLPHCPGPFLFFLSPFLRVCSSQLAENPAQPGLGTTPCLLGNLGPRLHPHPCFLDSRPCSLLPCPSAPAPSSSHIIFQALTVCTDLALTPFCSDSTATTSS